jgi:hypothetical protein
MVKVKTSLIQWNAIFVAILLGSMLGLDVVVSSGAQKYSGMPMLGKTSGANWNQWRNHLLPGNGDEIVVSIATYDQRFSRTDSLQAVIVNRSSLPMSVSVDLYMRIDSVWKLLDFDIFGNRRMSSIVIAIAPGDTLIRGFRLVLSPKLRRKYPEITLRLLASYKPRNEKGKRKYKYSESFIVRPRKE